MSKLTKKLDLITTAFNFYNWGVLHINVLAELRTVSGLSADLNHSLVCTLSLQINTEFN